MTASGMEPLQPPASSQPHLVIMKSFCWTLRSPRAQCPNPFAAEINDLTVKQRGVNGAWGLRMEFSEIMKQPKWICQQLGQMWQQHGAKTMDCESLRASLLLWGKTIHIRRHPGVLWRSGIKAWVEICVGQALAWHMTMLTVISVKTN